MIQAAAVGIGFAAGILGGLVGIGGGIVMIPALIYFMGYGQRMAQGTTLAAMVLPIGFLAAWEYYKNGLVNLQVALFIAMGFFFGGYLGARFAVGIDDIILKKVFGVMLLGLSIKMIFFE